MFGDIFSTRRSFLTRGLTLVGAGVTVPAFIERSAAALAAPAGTRAARGGGGDQRVLVVVQLAGGNDGLNTVVPTTNDLYFKRRPTLAIARGQALKLTDDAGLHPSLKGLKALYDAGSLAVVQGVGYPNPNRSHFQSTDIWSTASPDGKLHTGWIGRYFDAQCKGQDPPNPKAGVSLTAEMPLAMLGQKFAPVAFQKPESLSWNEGKKRPIRRGMVGDNPQQAAFERLNQPERKGREVSELDYLQRTALDARISAADIQTAARGSAAVNYPNTPLAGSLRTVARMIAANMPTRIYYLQQGGFDTHTGQQNRHPQLLSQLGDAIKAFCDDLRASKQFDRVTLMTFSEFGRRVEENASGGTDHGTAAPLFIAGGQVKAGILGAAPSLEKLDAGDLIYTTDFRGVYASMLKDWLGADAGKLLGGQFSPLPIFKRA